MLTGQSSTATTDATGAAKFSAVKSGSTNATGWSYSASSLATSVIEKIDAVEKKHWTMAYATNSDLTRVTDVTGGNRIGRSTSYDIHGRILAALLRGERDARKVREVRDLVGSDAAVRLCRIFRHGTPCVGSLGEIGRASCRERVLVAV